MSVEGELRYAVTHEAFYKYVLNQPKEMVLIPDSIPYLKDTMMIVEGELLGSRLR
jgi:hypothetical protein